MESGDTGQVAGSFAVAVGERGQALPGEFPGLAQVMHRSGSLVAAEQRAAEREQGVGGLAGILGQYCYGLPGRADGLL